MAKQKFQEGEYVEWRIPVIFLTNSAPYNAGERAGFKEDLAHDLVRRGVAAYVDPDDAPPVVELSEKDKKAAAKVTEDDDTRREAEMKDLKAKAKGGKLSAADAQRLKDLEAQEAKRDSVAELFREKGTEEGSEEGKKDKKGKGSSE